MISIEKIINKAKKKIPSLNEQRVLDAYNFANLCHSGQKRASGEDYIYHPLAIADIILDFLPDEDALLATLLHDVTEDCGIKVEEIKKRYGPVVAELVSGMEKLSHVKAYGQERQIGSLRKMFLAMAKDIRVVIIKLADRLHNMQSLHFLRPDKQKRIAEETLTIYAPIAARLGIYDLKSPLEDLSFFYLQQDKYTLVAEQMKKHEPYRTRILKNAKKYLSSTLHQDGIKGEITGRIKHYYSINKKMERKSMESIDDLYDIFALRIIVPSVKDCYVVLGRIHQYWTPLAKRFKDYIAVPKPNGYRSLHTTVIGLSGIKNKSVPIEIQIRTQNMQHEAQYGIAAHWAYKEDKKKTEEKSVWVQHLVELENKIKSNKEFVADLKLDTFSDRIFVLTPNGDIKDMPRNATPIDFAFAVHTDIGLRTKAAKVNGNIVPLDHTLKNGNVVEIITSKKNEVNQNWISFVKTAAAKNRIKNYLKSQNKDKIIRDGKEALNKELIRFDIGEMDPHMHILKNINGQKRNIKEREEVLERIGNGSLSPLIIVKSILKDQGKYQEQEYIGKSTDDVAEDKKPGEILISGEKEIPIKISNCCNPMEGEPIIGFTTRGGHVSIHHVKCKMILGLDPHRLIDAKWTSDKSEIVELIVKTNSNRIGLLKDIIDVFVRYNISIEKFSYSERINPLTSNIHLQITVSDFSKIALIMDKLEDVNGVAEVMKSNILN